MRLHLPLIGFGATMTAASPALAETLGIAEPWQLGFQTPVTSLMQEIVDFHWWLMIVVTLITLFVVGLLGYAIWKFDSRRNPNPARFTHHAVIEVVWTLVPILILIPIAAQSLGVLYNQKTLPENPDVTIKAIGHQWRWEYMYDVNGEQVFVDSTMLGLGAATWDDAKRIFAENDLPEDRWPTEETWKLEVSDYMVVPVNAVVRLQVTASDVIHAWTVPAFGVKTDAMPGRLNELWFQPEVLGTFYGQCSELCGKDHAYMPIRVDVVTQEEYDAYLNRIYDEYAAAPDAAATRVASAD